MINMLKETFVVDDDVEGLNIISSKFKNRKVGKKKNDEESSLEEERQKKKKMLEEIMQKKVRKNSKKDECEKPVGYLVTEDGLMVETEEPCDPLPRRRDHKSILTSVATMEKTKGKLKFANCQRRESTLETPADLTSRRTSLNTAEILLSSQSSPLSSRRPSGTREMGLLESKQLAEACRKFWATVMVGRAVATMKAQRRRRMAYNDIMKIKRIPSLKSTLAITRFIKRSPSIPTPENKKLEFSFSSLINGIGKFKKIAQNKDSETSKENEDIPIFSMKSLSAAGKFKKKRNQEESHKRKVALESFLSWFEDSQALQRVLNMQRQNKTRDDFVSKELLYMIKRESARRKKVASALDSRVSGYTTEDVEEVTSSTLEHLNFIKNWVIQRSTSPVEPLNNLNDVDDEVVISLTSKNPQQQENVCYFDNNTRSFQRLALREVTMCLLEIPSSIINRDSSEAKKQLEREKTEELALQRRRTLNIEETDEIKTEVTEQRKNRKKYKSKEKDRKEKTKSKSKDRKKSEERFVRPTNQFKKLERGTQTSNRYSKDVGIQVEPVQTLRFTGLLNQWVIYDKYIKYEAAKELAEASDNKISIQSVRRRYFDKEEESIVQREKKKMKRCALILERMVNQNVFNDISLDFRFYEDLSDEFKEKEGSLLPLWTFEFSPAAGLETTALCWNTSYSDLFAVGYGSYDLKSQDDPGLISVFSLKNPSYPEFICNASSGIMCLDFHPTHPHMVAAGLRDGRVAVFNLQTGGSDPVYQSTALNGKHRDTVWQVRWVGDDLDNYLNFFSVSEDSRITQWTLVRSSLSFSDSLVIGYTKPLLNISPEKLLNEKLGAGCRALAFKPDEENVYIVGTEEGLIHLCTREFASKWNSFLPRVFISCAAEWRVKIWDMESLGPLYTLDLSSPVGDVSWAPYSSTTLAAVTQDGKVHVYDMHFDRYNPLCVQQIVNTRRSKLNHISFNPSFPIIIVGDCHGRVVSLKLSPNLRKQSKDVKVALISKDTKKAGILEVKKMKDLLSQVQYEQDIGPN